jgi:hypothetical protein
MGIVAYLQLYSPVKYLKALQILTVFNGSFESSNQGFIRLVIGPIVFALVMLPSVGKYGTCFLSITRFETSVFPDRGAPYRDTTSTRSPSLN